MSKRKHSKCVGLSQDQIDRLSKSYTPPKFKEPELQNENDPDMIQKHLFYAIHPEMKPKFKS